MLWWKPVGQVKKSGCEFWIYHTVTVSLTNGYVLGGYLSVEQQGETPPLDSRGWGEEGNNFWWVTVNDRSTVSGLSVSVRIEGSEVETLSSDILLFVD